MRKVSYCFYLFCYFRTLCPAQKDIQWNPSNGMNFVEFEVWEPGIPVSEDDNFTPGEIERAF
ncbi:MAG: hypothetical protein ACLU4J_11100 [Butyricimonas paravirosa]